MQKVVITGGTGGLGGAVVTRLSREYDCVVLGHTDVDLRDEEAVRRVFAEIGPIYALVHLVGGWAGGRIAETSLASFEDMLSKNLTTAFLAAREALVHLSSPGRIVAVSSIVTLNQMPGSAAYTIAKMGLNALIQTIAAEQKASGITANAVLPGSMATPAMIASGADVTKLVPPARVAETIAFLLSEAAAGTTGTLIPLKA